MEQFISCDWGTSSFRLRLINASTKKVEAEIKQSQGIAATFALWKAQNDLDKLSFYSTFLLQQIVLLEQQCGHLLNGHTVIISGMASAAIGMIELPYINIPFEINKATLATHIVPAESGRNKMIIVSGVRSEVDVIRGEETILTGCHIEDMPEEQLFIFPGTHSKHVVVQNGMLKEIKTFMTGEVFDLLSNNSILAGSVDDDKSLNENSTTFIKGIIEASSSDFLNSVFHVRTNILLHNLSKKDNYHYLSGLLIGEELKNLLRSNYHSITIVSTGLLLALYAKALSVLGFKDRMQQQDADEALIKGQIVVFNHCQ